MKYLRYLVLGLLLASTQLASAADVLMRLNREQIDLLGSTYLEIVYVDMQGSPPALPSVEGLDIQFNGQSTQTQIINFQRSTKEIYRYLITPKQTGSFTIGPLDFQTPTGSKTLQANLRVTSSSDDQVNTPLSDLFYATIQCSHPTAYVYAPFECILEVYAAAHLQTANEIAIRGGLPEQGLKQPLTWQQHAQETVEIEGIRFNKSTFKAQATAIRAGRFVFQPQVQLSLLIPRESRRSSGLHDPFFGDFFGRTEKRPLLLDCNSVTVEALSLPTQNRPDSFSGGVGNYVMDAEVSHQEIVVGDPLTVQISIKGRGQIDTVRAPEFPDHALYKRYPAQTIERTDDTLIVEQTLMVTSTDLQEIPALDFSFFDPIEEVYHTKKVGPFPLRVLPTTLNPLTTASIPGDSDDQANGSTLRYLKPKPTSWHTPYTFTTTYLLLLATPLVGWLMAGGILIWRRKRYAGETHQRNLATHTLLKEAKTALKQNDADRFAEAIHTLLHSSDEIRDVEKTEALRNQLLDTLHASRYGQRRLTPETMQSLLTACVSLLNKRGQKDD